MRPVQAHRPRSRGAFGRVLGKGEDREAERQREPGLAARFGVRSIPMLALFKEGAVSDVKVGAAPKKDYADWFAANVR